MERIKILHEPTEEEPFLVIDKPRGLPSAPLAEGDESAYTQAAYMFPELNSVMGKKLVEHGLVHRIDTQTAGLLLIASSQKFYDYIQLLQNKGSFIKYYKAVCHIKKQDMDGFPECPVKIDFNKAEFSCTLESRFRPYGNGRKEVRPVNNQAGRAALKKASDAIYKTTVYGKLNSDDTIDVSCNISKGYRHQVRCHLAWLGIPILGDPLYSDDADTEDFCFMATGFSFVNWDGTLLKFHN